jgi:hypothetical protein
MPLCNGNFDEGKGMSRIKCLIHICLIIIAIFIFISSTYIESIGRFSRNTISVVTDIIYLIAVILIVRRSLIKNNEN